MELEASAFPSMHWPGSDTDVMLSLAVKDYQPIAQSYDGNVAGMGIGFVAWLPYSRYLTPAHIPSLTTMSLLVPELATFTGWQ